MKFFIGGITFIVDTWCDWEWLKSNKSFCTWWRSRWRCLCLQNLLTHIPFSAFCFCRPQKGGEGAARQQSGGSVYFWYSEVVELVILEKNQQYENVRISNKFKFTKTEGAKSGKVIFACTLVADYPAMSFFFVCWHSRRWWPPIRGGILQMLVLWPEKLNQLDFLQKLYCICVRRTKVNWNGQKTWNPPKITGFLSLAWYVAAKNRDNMILAWNVAAMKPSQMKVAPLHRTVVISHKMRTLFKITKGI